MYFEGAEAEKAGEKKCSSKVMRRGGMVVGDGLGWGGVRRGGRGDGNEDVMCCFVRWRLEKWMREDDVFLNVEMRSEQRGAAVRVGGEERKLRW